MWSDGIAFGDDLNNLRSGYHNSTLHSSPLTPHSTFLTSENSETAAAEAAAVLRYFRSSPRTYFFAGVFSSTTPITSRISISGSIYAPLYRAE